MPNWQPFRYADFWDIPHLVYTTDGARAFVLDCPFDDALDDFPPGFTVHAAPVVPLWSRQEFFPPALKPPCDALPRLGTVVLTRAHLDPTFRERLDWDLLAQWL